MSGHIGKVVCFVFVLMTSGHVKGQNHDVAHLNRRLTIIKNSIDDDIDDIRLEIMELKTIVEQIVVGPRNASDGSIIGQGMTGADQKEITDLKTKLTTHEHRLNTLFSTVNKTQVEHSALKRKVNQLIKKNENEEKRNELINNLKAELLLQLNADFETKCGDRVNSLQKKFEETVALMITGYKNQKTHMSDQIHNISQSVISDQNNESVNKNVNEVERNKLINNLEAQLLQLNAVVETKFNDKVNAIQKKFEETEAMMMKDYKNLKTHMSDEMHNLSQSVISDQNKLSTRMDNRVNALQKKFDETAAVMMADNKDLKTHVSDQMKNLSQSLISEQNKLSSRIDKAEGNIVKLDGGANKLDGPSRAIAEMKTKTDKCCIDCGDPTPDHGTVNTTETTYGTVVQISCNHGYVLSGTSIIKCNVDFVWSESATCIPYDCGSADPSNGVATAPNGTTFQQQATVQCNTGYTLNGSSVIACKATGWNDSVSCVLQNCGDPTPDHGAVNTTETTYGTVVQISCNHGYVLSGPSIIKCNVDFVWSESATCIPYDCGDPTPDHGTVNTTETTYGTVVQISCNHGYVLSGPSIIKCNADSAWSESATCNPYDCGSAAPSNGVVIATSGTTYRQQATLQCNRGYTLNGSSVIECNETGWNGTVSCVKQSDVNPCYADFFPCQNGRCIPKHRYCDESNNCDDGSDEDRCHETVSCEADYFRCKNDRCIRKDFRCDGDNDCGDGSDENECHFSDCGYATPEHGTVNTTATTYGTVVKISCNHGYLLWGPIIIKCNARSAWSASVTCYPYGQQPISANGYRVKTIFGSDLEKYIKTGTRVVRGRDCDWCDQDGEGPGPGTVIALYSDRMFKVVLVKWDKGVEKIYRNGADRKYSLFGDGEYIYRNGMDGQYDLLILADGQ